MSFISQLECVGGLSRWAVYAALHIPDAEQRCKVGRLAGPMRRGEHRVVCAKKAHSQVPLAYKLRSPWRAPTVISPPPCPPRQVVRELLAAHVDEWSEDEEAEEFLRQRLRLPGAWLAEAQALWARYCQDDAGEGPSGCPPLPGRNVVAARPGLAADPGIVIAHSRRKQRHVSERQRSGFALAAAWGAAALSAPCRPDGCAAPRRPASRAPTGCRWQCVSGPAFGLHPCACRNRCHRASLQAGWTSC